MTQSFSGKIIKKILSDNHKISEYDSILNDPSLVLCCDTRECALLYEIKKVITFIVKHHEEKNSFFAKLAHDIKAPMVSINIALRNSNKDKLIRDVFSINFYNLNLLDTILDSYKIKNSIVITEFNIVELLKNVINNHKYLSKEKKLTTKIISKNEKIYAKTSEVSLYRILSNLLSNAIKYSPYGKTLKVYVKNHKNSAEITFSNFIDKNNDPVSYGLGLEIIKSMIKRINAKIFREDKKNTVNFTLKFPCKI